ncbi:MAG: hypothetical protein WBP64_12830 [Nitrososphaeraceae archaeon]
MTIPEYKLRSYEELSKEFTEKASRAFELVPMMYDRLTLVDQLSHKQAVKKIFNDHADIRGFSFRNISRYLPLDNPVIPRQVMPARRKSIPTHNPLAQKLSNADLQDETKKHQSHDREDPIQFTDYNELRTQNAELKEVISRQKAMVMSDKIHSIEIAFRIPKEKYEILHIAMNGSNEFIRVIFNRSGMFERAESDVKSRIN